MRQQQIEKLIFTKRRRLDILEEQNAQQGVHTPPHIIIEIEDLKLEIEALELQRDKIRSESGVAEQVQRPKATESKPAPNAIPQHSTAETPEPASSPQPTTQTPLPDTLTLAKPFQMEFVHIPAGEFLMGSDPAKDKDAQKNEQPQHKVTLPDYYIAKYPVTNIQYAAFVKATGHKTYDNWKGGSKFPMGDKTHPANYVSWDDAVAFCRWVSRESGQTVRLPTEAEWEKAARGPSTNSGQGRIYPWGDDFDSAKLNSSQGGPGKTTPGGHYSPDGDSPYGLADMAGNVWEWCSTGWDEKAYPFKVQDEWTEDYIKRTNVFRVLRGGSWNDSPQYTRCACRNGDLPDARLSYGGFRVVVSPSF